MIVFDNILRRLADSGWSTYRLINEQVFGNSTITRLRNGSPINTTTIDTICRLCDCQPGDIMSYVPDQEAKERG